ncbi:MAG: hypothetical protein EP297_15515 [Gammaproteobacteria bacterium]|nr:MAG: hypothetical protein EP297_15515 [Gammaproteobacteria bacterium]
MKIASLLSLLLLCFTATADFDLSSSDCEKIFHTKQCPLGLKCTALKQVLVNGDKRLEEENDYKNMALLLDTKKFTLASARTNSNFSGIIRYNKIIIDSGLGDQLEYQLFLTHFDGIKAFDQYAVAFELGVVGYLSPIDNKPIDESEKLQASQVAFENSGTTYIRKFECVPVMQRTTK